MRRWILTATALVVALMFLFPFWWAISLSLRPPLESYAVTGLGIPWLDFAPTLDSWRAQLAVGRIRSALGHSTAIALAATAIAMVLGVPAAYALARAPGARQNDLMVIGFLIIRLLPPIALVIPLYLLVWWLDLLDTAVALVAVNATLLVPLVIVLMRQAFRDLPREIEEAAALDGAGPWRTLRSMVLPLTAPAIAATALVVFAFAWNDYIFALSFFVLDLHTMPLMVQALGSPSPGSAVRMLLAMALPVIVALLAQRYLIRGLTLGALKG